MQTRRALLRGIGPWSGAAVCAAYLSVFPSPAAGADSEDWCDVDPPVLIRTPRGSHVIVFVANAGPIEHIVTLALPHVEQHVTPTTDYPGTEVRLLVTSADSHGHGHTMASEVWTGPARTGERLSQRAGVMGHPIEHVFRLYVQ